MRGIFYSPMVKPDADAASGTQRMAVLLQRALGAAGFAVSVPDLPRTYDGKGEAARQQRAKAESEAAAAAFLARIGDGSVARPDLWFSYHVYYKSPDWIGPAVSRALRIPYLIAEGSHAPKRNGGPWALGHDGATQALTSASRLLAMTAFDRFCLDQIAPGRVHDLKPFIDPAPFAEGPIKTAPVKRLIAVGMMRNERKRASYELLAAALRLLPDLDLALSIAGDGAYRAAVEAIFKPAAPGHDIWFSGAVAPHEMPLHLGGSHILAWPGIGEAYGLVFLEAQAAGLPVVACADRGVPDAVRAGETALLSAPSDVAGYASSLRRLIGDETLRKRMGDSARSFVQRERSVEAAGRTLRGVCAELGLA